MHDVCELRDWAVAAGYGPCSAGLTIEHIISKGMLRNNKAGRKLVDKVYPYLFQAEVCLNHNSNTKCADTTEARLYLLRKRRREWEDVFEDAVEELRATFKSPPEYLRLEFLAE